MSEEKLTIESVERETEVLRKIAHVLDPYEREAQLRILEATCTLLGEDGFARKFREARAAGKAIGRPR